MTQKKVSDFGLGAGSADYIDGSARKNGYQKGDADLVVNGTNIFIEVTGPLVSSVKESDPLWFRPDKFDNAINNSEHDVFFAHNCMSTNLWRVIHVESELKRRYENNEFSRVQKYIRGNLECYIEIAANDNCLRKLDYLVEYIKRK